MTVGQRVRLRNWEGVGDGPTGFVFARSEDNPHVWWVELDDGTSYPYPEAELIPISFVEVGDE